MLQDWLLAIQADEAGPQPDVIASLWPTVDPPLLLPERLRLAPPAEMSPQPSRALIFPVHTPGPEKVT